MFELLRHGRYADGLHARREQACVGMCRQCRV